MQYEWTNAPWVAFAYFNGIVGTLAMLAALTLTLYSLGVYLRRLWPLLLNKDPCKSSSSQSATSSCLAYD